MRGNFSVLLDGEEEDVWLVVEEEKHTLISQKEEKTRRGLDY